MSELSALVFSPQNAAPNKKCLDLIRSILNNHEAALKPLQKAVLRLPETWELITNSMPELASLKTRGISYTKSFSTWLELGATEELENNRSGIVALPLLIIIHVAQYYEYLRVTGISHSDLLHAIRKNHGSVQGYCIGLVVALVVATSKNETELIENAAAALRITLGIAAFGELGCDATNPGPTTMAVRLRDGIDADEITHMFPQSHISAISDSKNISITAPASQIPDIRSYITTRLGLLAKMIHLQSNIHNPKHRSLAVTLQKFCSLNSKFQIPHSSHMQVPVRSNQTGEVLTDCSLTDEIIRTILTACCDWSTVMARLAGDLQLTGIRFHKLAMVGMGDFLPLSSFQENNLEITKIDVFSVITNKRNVSSTRQGDLPPGTIAIVGAACRLPGANSLEELWELIACGESKVENLREDRVKMTESFRVISQELNSQKWYGNFVDNIDEFDNAFFGISPKEAANMDPQQRLLLITAFEAMDASGYLRRHRRNDGDPIGCFIGASYTEYLENTTAYAPTAFTATGTIRAFLSGKVSYHFGWTGPSEVIDTACSSSLVAIHHACRAIQAGDCPMALAGGINLITGVHNYLDLGKAGFLSRTGQCKPFDEAADGYCRADGVGLVVLKPLQQAIRDRDNILGLIPATVTNQGGLSPGITVPHDRAQQALYRQLLEKAGIAPRQVTFVEAHGTGTQVGDSIEAESIRKVFGCAQRSDPLYIGSLKANIGHSETAAGVASLIKVLAMFAHGGIPPQASFTKLNHKITGLEPAKIKIATELLAWEANPRIACVNGYGASGSNAALICSEWVAKGKVKILKWPAPLPVILSAYSKESLQAYANILASYILKAGDSLSLGDIAFTLSERRKQHRFQWSAIVSDLPNLIQLLRSDVKQQISEPPSPTDKTRKRVVLTFSGQAKTTIGLDPRLCEIYPRFQHYLERCNTILLKLGHRDIMAALYQVDAISDVMVLQTGTFAVQYSCAQCWLDGGLKVDALLGHSFGELTALAVSGVLSLEDALNLVAKRASLIETAWGPESGTMLAIHTDLETVQHLIKLVEAGSLSSDDNDSRLEIACYNSLGSYVVVGTRSSVTMAERMIEENSRLRGVRHQSLNVSHGFHSKLTEPILPGLGQYIKTLIFNPPTIPIETCTRYMTETITSEYLVDHTRKPVYFVDAVRRLEQQLGPCVWLEAGWNTPIIAMTRKALARPEGHCFQALRNSPTAVSMATTCLWKEGISASWWGFLSLSSTNSSFRHIWLPPYQFIGSRYWLDHVDRATEAAKKLPFVNPESPKLAHYIGPSEKHHEIFQIDTNTTRYRTIVGGHAVLKQPLCPVSMYMEMAVMCAEELKGFDFGGKTISFHNLVFHNGLGCRSNDDVRLFLSKHDGSATTWQFSVQSSRTDMKVQKASKVTHAEGRFDANNAQVPDFRLYELLLSKEIESLRNDPNVERLRTTTAYSLFSRVVDYGDLLQGISLIILGQSRALANIIVPDTDTDCGKYESSVSHFLDAISLDTFIQVVGLGINSSGEAANDEVFVATAVKKITILPCDFRKQKKWTVYAIFSSKDDTQASGDIFVFSEVGKLVVIGSGITFSRVRVKSLARLLKGVNDVEHSATKTKRHDRITPAVEIGSYKKTGFMENNSNLIQCEALKALLSSYTGIPASQIQDNESFGSLGLDSLSSVELADELKAKFGLETSAESLLTSDIAALLQKGTLSSASFDTLLDSGAMSSLSSSSALPSRAYTPLSPTDGENGVMGQDSNDRDPNGRWRTRHRVETVGYKEIDGVEILADIFIPLEQSSQAMPIALLFHGGGYMTLSRKAVRPAQIQFLLSNGVLPISFDYSLCPQVNVIDGAMVDAREAYAWAMGQLPGILLQATAQGAGGGIVVDPSKIVIVGWSTGGHLAMTLAWTTIAAGLPPPRAILAFYCPTVYDPSDESLQMGKEYPSRTMSMSEIRDCLDLEAGPVTGHSFSSTDNTGLGWIKPGDPRSELVLSLIQEKHGVTLLLDGIPNGGDQLGLPDPQQVAAISPITQVKRGNYHTATFLIIGDRDEIVPFHTAVNFSECLKERGIRNGFLAVPGAKHIYDLMLSPGSTAWDQWVLPGYCFLFDMLGNDA